MVSTTPLTVILPVRNGEAFIGSAIRSVLNQSFKDFELWVLENGSDDKTVEIVKSFNDPRIKLFELGPVGLQGAMRFALENTTTEWLARMDADDLMFPDRLDVQMNLLKSKPEITFVGTAYAVLTPFGHIIEHIPATGSREVTKYLLASKKRLFADPSVIFNRQAAIDAGGIDEDFTKQPDVPLWFRLLEKGKGWEIAEPLHLYRLQSTSLSKGGEHGNQSSMIRGKYASEFIAAWAQTNPHESFWQYIARLTLISGDMKSVRRAVSRMRQEGPFKYEANLMAIRALLGKPSSIYYRWRNRSKYRHRPDWERFFAPILQPTNAYESGDF